MQIDGAILVSTMHLGNVREDHAGAVCIRVLSGHVVQTEDDVLRRHDDRLAVRGRQDVVRRHHQRARLELRLDRQRHVDGHLVAIEVRVKGRADQRMQLNSLALDEDRFECLNAEAMQRRRPVQQDRMLADHFFEDVPDLGALALDQLLRGLDGRRFAAQLQLAEDERLEQLERHLLRQAALVQAQRRTHHDDRATRVVHALAQQVLPEPALLALDHVGQRLQRTAVRPRYRATSATIVEQRVDRLLQHAFLVAHDNIGRIELEQTTQSIIAVDHPTIQVIQVRCGEAATVQRDERSQVRRQNRQYGQHHPLRLVAGLQERLEQLQPLRQALDLRLRVRGVDLLADIQDGALEIDRAQHLMHRLRAHGRVELVTILLDRFEILLVRQHLAALERRQAGIGHDEGLEIQNSLDLAERHVQHQADSRRQRLQEPDMRSRAGELDMSHALAPDLGLDHLDAALLADDAAVLHPLVLAAQALVVLDRAEDLGAEQAVALGLERAVVDRLRLLDLAERPRPDHLGRCEADANRIEVFDATVSLKKLE